MDRGRGRRHDDRALPNLLVPIDVRDGQATGPSLFALSECRRVAHAAGASVFALAFTDRPLADALADRLGRAGADKVLICEGPELGAPPLDITHGLALYAAVERVPPLLVLFPAGGMGRELGPPLAARLGGGFTAAADLELGTAAVALADGVGRVFLRSWDRDRAGYRLLDPVDLERPVVGILQAGGRAVEIGGSDVEMEVIECSATARLGVVEISSEPDDQAAVSLAPVLVVVDPTLAPTARAALAKTAAAGIPVVAADVAAAALAGAIPQLVITVGRQESLPGTTPRSRIGAVRVEGSAGGLQVTADAVWMMGSAESNASWADLDAALAAIAPPVLAGEPR